MAERARRSRGASACARCAARACSSSAAGSGCRASPRRSRAGACSPPTGRRTRSRCCAQRRAQRPDDRGAERVSWTEPEALLARAPWDLVLASDVLYEPRNGEALLPLLPRLVDARGEIWLADPGRPPAGAVPRGGGRDVRDRVEPRDASSRRAASTACACGAERGSTHYRPVGSSARARLRVLAPPRRGRRHRDLRDAAGGVPHRAASAPAAGLHGLGGARVAEAPWLEGSGPAYEDWYALADWAALGRLNEAAVRGERAGPHDAVAARAAAGAGASTAWSRVRPSSPPRGRAGSPSRPDWTARRSTRSSRARAARSGCGRWCSAPRRSTRCARALPSCSRRRAPDRRRDRVMIRATDVEQAALAALDPDALARDAAAASACRASPATSAPVLERSPRPRRALGPRAELHEHDLAALRAHPGPPGRGGAARRAVGPDRGAGRRRARGGCASTATSTSSAPARRRGAHGPWSGALADGRAARPRRGRHEGRRRRRAARARRGPHGRRGGARGRLQAVRSEEDGGLGHLRRARARRRLRRRADPRADRLRVVCAQAGALTFRGVVPGGAAHAA